MGKDFDCMYHNEENSRRFLAIGGLKSCELACPASDSKICYRWNICSQGEKARSNTVEED